MNGQLEFVSGEDMEVLNAAEHFLATEIEWDPTGRYVATAVTAMQKMENGLNMWLFNGQLIYRSGNCSSYSQTQSCASCISSRAWVPDERELSCESGCSRW